MNFLIFILIFIISLNIVFSIDINSTINIGLSNNIELKHLSNSILLQKLKVANKNLKLIPDLSLSMNYSKTIGSYYDNNIANLEANYVIYDGNLKYYQIEYENLIYKNLILSYEIKKKEIEYNIKTLFYEALLGKIILEMREKNLQQAILEKKEASEKFKEGLIDKLSYYAAEQFFLLSEKNLLSANIEYKQKLDILKNYINYYEFNLLEGEIKEENNFDLYTNDIRVLNIELQKELASLNYKIGIAANDFNVSFYSKGSLISTNIITGFYSGNIELGIRIYLPLYDWITANISSSYNKQLLIYPYYSIDSMNISGNFQFFNENNNLLNKKESYITYENLILQYNNQIKQIESEIESYKNKLLELEFSIYLSSNSIELNKLNYDKIKILYDNGEKTAKELLDTRISIIDAEINYIRSILNYNNFVWKINSLKN